MDNKPKPATLSKKHIARLERERRQAAIIRWVAGLVILASILLVGYGLLEINVLRQYKPVATVNGEKVSLKAYQMKVRTYRQNLIGQYQMYQFYSQLGMDASQYMQQVADQLGANSAAAQALGQEALDALIGDVLVRQEAEKRGISVSDEEIEKEIQSQYNYYPDGTPTPQPYSTEMPAPTLSAEQLAIVTITPTATDLPTATPQGSPTPGPSATPTAVPSPTATSAPEPTATPYTLEGYQQVYDDALTEYDKSLKMSEADFRNAIKDQVLHQKVLEAVTADLPKTQQMVWARHILVADGAVAQVIRQRLLKGEDFAAVAAEVSTDPGSKDSGGDLGWFTTGAMVPAFEQAALSQKLFEIGEPVQSDYGYHIIQVLGRYERPMTDSEFKEAQQRAFDEWLAETRAEAEITTNDELWRNNTPVDPVLQVESIPY